MSKKAERELAEFAKTDTYEQALRALVKSLTNPDPPLPAFSVRDGEPCYSYSYLAALERAEALLAREAPLVTPGVYRHYKGKDYFVRAVIPGVGGTTPLDYVHYQAIHEPGGRQFVRGLENFTEMIKRPGYEGPRFYRI